MHRTNRHAVASVCVLALLAGPWSAAAGGVELTLPLGRDAYQTNESIHLAVVRSSAEALPAGDLVLTVTGADGSRLAFTLAVPAVAVAGKNARTTEHLYLNGRLLRPGRYRVRVAGDGGSAETTIDVFAHVRRTSFKLIPWGRSKGAQQLAEGEDSLGFNLIYAAYNDDGEANFIRAGCDVMKCCTMSGAHQMDLRSECDWSDPYVTRGGTVRVARQALADRTRGNTIGVHFYDEPGLTHLKHPVTGEHTPHGIPSQHRSYESAFGRKPPFYKTLDPKDRDAVARWKHFARWKLSFMDAAWKEAQFGVSQVRPDYLSATQSQYGWTAFADGYYFNVARCLPIVSGHGGYHDYGLYLFNASYFLEFARARDLAKPCWYLPCWYGSTTSEQFRMEQYLSFQTGIQGLQTPPDIDPFEPAKKPAAGGVVESNKLAARLGTIFTTMPPTRPPVAVLYSMSHILEVQAHDRTMNYAHADNHVRVLQYVYLAGKMTQHPVMPIVDEDVADGTLSANHKAVIVAGVNHLDPEVLAGLEAFAADGGKVLLCGGGTLKVKGAADLGVNPKLPRQALVDKLMKAGKWEEAKPHMTLGKLLAAAKPLGEALAAALTKAGIEPVLACDNTGIAATRHAAGDVEYLFAVNASTDWAGENNNTIATVATIALAGTDRPVYDAVHGGPAAGLEKQAGQMTGTFRFGPGQMRVFARSARPIGSVGVFAPVVRRDYTITDAPLTVELAAAVLDKNRGALGGSIPLRVRMVDPLGACRYDLYRATRAGVLRLALPLAVNDPAGTWTVTVRELLANTMGTATFELPAVARCGALAGRKTRAVHFGRDRENIFRFFRVHRKVTLAIGKSAYNRPAAERLAKSLVPWDVQCTIAQADDLNKPRTLPEGAAKTWVGLGFGRVNPKKLAIAHVGFAVDGPVVLLGTPEDNPLIAYLLKNRFLPYAPKADVLPGRGRGMLAWQRDGVGHGIESITAIAHDDAGMAEAIGTLYEAAAGMEPLTALVPPKANRLAPATKADVPPAPKVAWQVVLPDRAVAMRADGDKLIVLTRDESLSTIDATGAAGKPQPLKPADYARRAEAMAPATDQAAAKLAKDHPVVGRIVKFAVAAGAGRSAIGYWGGLLRILDADGKVLAAHPFQHDLAGLAARGDSLAVGLSDGRVVCLQLP